MVSLPGRRSQLRTLPEVQSQFTTQDIYASSPHQTEEEMLVHDWNRSRRTHNLSTGSLWKQTKEVHLVCHRLHDEVFPGRRNTKQEVSFSG